ncbi:MAG TPA: TRAP transporter large permease subunit, partial [Alphaproteobacteria bacterium]|nr:TRAP transporter large permease subunit [Alphaproteobacteria bacterium]
MSPEIITLLMFATMMLLLVTGQRVFGVIGFVGAAAALWLWGDGAAEMPFNASFQVLNWYPLITVPFFVFMGYMLSESGIAGNLYRMFHVWFGPVRGGLALGTIGLMVLISCMNGLSVAGMAIGATVALPELLRHRYDKVMVTGVIQAGSSLGILVPPSVVLVLYAMIARQPVLQLWLAGILPGLMMATIFAIYIYMRCRLQPDLGPALPDDERAQITWAEKISLLREGLLPLAVFGGMMGLFLTGVTSLVESSAVGALLATLAALFSRRLTRKVLEDTTRNTLAISCMFLWIILAALCFSTVYDGLGAVRALETLLLDTWVLEPWT